MLVRKEIDINEMIDILENAVSESEEKGIYIVRIDVSSVLMLLDVLRETKQREQKHQTLESALTFLEMEDGTQTNLQELSEIQEREENIISGMKEEMDCFGNFDRRDEICVTCNCGILCRENTEVVEKEEKEMVFFTENEDGTKEEKKVSRCYGNYKTRESGFCNECQEATACKRASILRRKVTDE